MASGNNGQYYDHPNIDLFPPAFNRLRRTLHDSFPTLWKIVGGMMVHDHEHFLEYMNAALIGDGFMGVDPRQHTLEEGCELWLNELVKLKEGKRNISNIILPSGRSLQ